MPVHVQMFTGHSNQPDAEWITTDSGEYIPYQPGPLTSLSRQYLADSKRWFPHLHDTMHDEVVHFTLGVAGEVGEVANLVKKWNRGSIETAQLRSEVAHELADVIAYTLDLAASMGIDLDRALTEKRAVCEQRWGRK